MRRALIAGTAAALAGALLAVAVSAHTTHYESSVNINAFTNGSVGNYFYGAITSSKPACAPKRKVIIFEGAGGPDDTKFGSETSIDSGTPGVGSYTITAPSGDIPSGDYYSKAKRRDLRKGRAHDHVCDRAKSSMLEVFP